MTIEIPNLGGTAADDGATRLLQAELSGAVRHLGGLENKRLALFVGHLVTVSLSALALAVLPSTRAALGLAIAAWIMGVSLACRQIALSERRATERYRNKINLLRRTWLDHVGNPQLWAMQRLGAANGLQVDDNPPKRLRWTDLLSPPQWTTALFMLLVYDLAALLGAGLLINQGIVAR